jgi:hypothetical protein
MTHGKLGCDDILTHGNVRSHKFVTSVIDMWIEVLMDEPSMDENARGRSHRILPRHY